MKTFLALAAALMLLGGCSTARQPYDDEDVTARASRPKPNAAAFMGYHGPMDSAGGNVEK